MNKGRVILADIARVAGVHPTTVSAALRNSPRLPEKTKQRLKRLAKEMGYIPDPGAQALAGYRRDQHAPQTVIPVGYVTNWNSRWGWREVSAHPDFFEGAKDRAGELGMSLEHFWLREPGLSHGRLSDILRARGINGLIIASHVRELDEELHFDWDHFSAVKIDYFPHHPPLPIVTNDQVSIVRLAVEKILAAGYKRIGFVLDDGWDITVDHLLSAGFLGEQQRIDPSLRIEPYVMPQKRTLQEWILENRPEVILSHSELVFPTLRAMRQKVPDDIAFADIFVEDESGRIAGVRQNCRAVGAAAVDILSHQLRNNIRGLPVIPTRTLVEGTWVEGKSLPLSARVRKKSESARR